MSSIIEKPIENRSVTTNRLGNLHSLICFVRRILLISLTRSGHGKPSSTEMLLSSTHPLLQEFVSSRQKVFPICVFPAKMAS